MKPEKLRAKALNDLMLFGGYFRVDYNKLSHHEVKIRHHLWQLIAFMRGPDASNKDFKAKVAKEATVARVRYELFGEHAPGLSISRKNLKGMYKDRVFVIMCVRSCGEHFRAHFTMAVSALEYFGFKDIGDLHKLRDELR